MAISRLVFHTVYPAQARFWPASPRGWCLGQRASVVLSRCAVNVAGEDGWLGSMQDYVEPFLGCWRNEMLRYLREIVVAHGKFVRAVVIPPA